MKQFLVVLLLCLPVGALAKTFVTPSGRAVNVPEPKVTWVEKTFPLPSGILWTELVPVARAEDLDLTLKEQIIAYASYMADKYGVSAKELNDLIDCESRFDPQALGDHGKAYGLAQFWEKTFNLFSKEAGFKNFEYHSWQNQVELLAWAWSKDKQEDWHNCWFYQRYGHWDKR